MADSFLTAQYIYTADLGNKKAIAKKKISDAPGATLDHRTAQSPKLARKAERDKPGRAIRPATATADLRPASPRA
jgi:hypothetical protein